MATEKIGVTKLFTENTYGICVVSTPEQEDGLSRMDSVRPFGYVNTVTGNFSPTNLHELFEQRSFGLPIDQEVKAIMAQAVHGLANLRSR